MTRGGPSAPSLTDLRDLTPESLPALIRVPPLGKPFHAIVRPPGSKSLTNRALLLAALAEGESVLRGALVDADDAQVMAGALTRLGANIEPQVAGDGATPPMVRVRGVAGRWTPARGEPVSLNLHNAGTATRFLAAAAALAPPETAVLIDGNERMRQRPIGELGDLLAQLGVDVRYLGKQGFPPLRVATGKTLDALANRLSIGPTASSQFVSALLLAGGFLPKGLSVQFEHTPTSEPYIHMTVGLLRRVGITVDDALPASIRVHPLPGARLPAFNLDIEPDASGTTYMHGAAAMISGAQTLIPGLSRASLQGDALFADVLAAMGASVAWLAPSVAVPDGGVRVEGGPHISPIDVDLSGMPDTAMTAAVLACFASPTAQNPTATSTLRGLRTLRVKETDRLAALQTELSKLGAGVEIVASGGTRGDEALRIIPPIDLLDPLVCVKSEPASVTFDTYDDHRMAMALSLVGLRRANTFIRNPACVAKTYPTFWRDLRSLYA